MPQSIIMQPKKIDIAVIGGGAAGVFAAIIAKETHPHMSVALFEKSAVFLAKVKVSGGGRCNVTHSCFDPKKLVQNYPRGAQEMLGPFHRFQPQDTIDWFEKRGVKLKTEKDGRMFPTTNQSQTIIDALLGEAKKLGVELHTRVHITEIKDSFDIHFRDGSTCSAKKLILATGSSAEGFKIAESLGHAIIPPVPSLFTFNVPTSRLKELSGIAVQHAIVSLPALKMKQEGPLLITHFGFSGPAVLKLSAWAARELHSCGYKTTVQIDWLPDENIVLPKNLSKAVAGSCKTLHADTYQMDGKTTHKEEFVTCGGVNLKEVDFRTMQSKIVPGLYFAGEILNIDGVTGGFNFQNAWTTGYLAGSASGS